MTERAKEGLVLLEEDDNGFWTMRKPDPPEVNIKNEFHVKVVKFFAPDRTCPIHGKVRVMDRDFDRRRMLSVEGLECGHALLITRVVSGLKKLKLGGGYPVVDRNVLDNQKFWEHRCWRMTFKETIPAS